MFYDIVVFDLIRQVFPKIYVTLLAKKEKKIILLIVLF